MSLLERTNIVEETNPGERHVACRMWLDLFESKIATKREKALAVAAFMCGWEAKEIADKREIK